VLAASDELFAHMIRPHEVADEAELRRFFADDAPDSFHPTLMTQVDLTRVAATGDLALRFTYSHTVFDALSNDPFHRDLDRLLAAPDPAAVPIYPLTPFRLFADLLHLYQDTALAQRAVAFNVHRLRGLSKFRAALWPRPRAPGWMIGSDAGCVIAGAAAGRGGEEERQQRERVRRRVWAEAGEPWDAAVAAQFHPIPRASRMILLPGIEALRRQRRVDPALLAKTALAVFSVRRTGQPYAVFNTVETGRSWPFVPDWMEELLRPPESIDGPTVEWVVNMPHVDLHAAAASPASSSPDGDGDGDGDGSGSGSGRAGGGEMVGQLIERMAAEDELLRRHSHAPWFKVLEALGPEEAAVLVDASMRQTFVWDLSLRLVHGANVDYKMLQWRNRFDWPDW